MTTRGCHFRTAGQSLLALLLTCACLFIAHPDGALAQVSPLETVMEGRGAAASSMLTEEGTRTMATSALNSFLYVCGALSVLLVAFGLYRLYTAQEGQNAMGTSDDAKRSAYWSIVIGSLLSIPVIIAAVIPFNILG